MKKINILKYIIAIASFIPILLLLFLFIGAYIPGRGLTDREIEFAKSIYSDGVEFSKVHIVYDSIYCTISPITLGNTIHIKSSWVKLDLSSDLTQTHASRNLLIHELGHTYQYQHEGWGYAFKSLFAQVKASILTGSRNGAYDWKKRIKDKTPWEKWNPEEQAEAISDYSYYLEFGNLPGADDGIPAKDIACFVPILRKSFCKI